MELKKSNSSENGYIAISQCGSDMNWAWRRHEEDASDNDDDTYATSAIQLLFCLSDQSM